MAILGSMRMAGSGSLWTFARDLAFVGAFPALACGCVCQGANSFLTHQIRKMVATAALVDSGELEIISSLFHGFVQIILHASKSQRALAIIKVLTSKLAEFVRARCAGRGAGQGAVCVLSGVDWQCLFGAAVRVLVRVLARRSVCVLKCA